MTDPLADVVGLLQPVVRFSKVVGDAGRWGVRRHEMGQTFYCVVLEGSCRLGVEGHESLLLEPGDFVLLPASCNSSMSSVEPALPDDFLRMPVEMAPGEFWLGEPGSPADIQLVVGHCEFGSPDATLLTSLLPQVIHVRHVAMLTTLVQLVRTETRSGRPARDVVLARLLEVMLIEALRSTSGTHASPGLLRGLADSRVGMAIRRMHEAPARAWTVAQLAGEAALSRSAFFERFSQAVGVTPMEYLLSWRMALAKTLLQNAGVADVAQRVGYSSASTFSVAFSRYVGTPPARYAAATR